MLFPRTWEWLFHNIWRSQVFWYDAQEPDKKCVENVVEKKRGKGHFHDHTLDLPKILAVFDRPFFQPVNILVIQRLYHKVGCFQRRLFVNRTTKSKNGKTRIVGKNLLESNIQTDFQNYNSKYTNYAPPWSIQKKYWKPDDKFGPCTASSSVRIILNLDFLSR